MGYWWVNHKQTFKQEITGGYIWSPKTNKNGARNQTYINLTLTGIGDTVFSYADGFIQAVGCVTKRCQDHLRPNEFGDTGEQWDREGWLVKVDWNLLEVPLRPKSYISQIAALLPKKYSPLRPNGNGKQNIYLAGVDESLADLIMRLIRRDNEV